MNDIFEEDDGFSPSSENRLVLDVDGFAGPIDVLLTLAREQKVDLTQISILELADQYLAWVAKLRQANLVLAADYLVMAVYFIDYQENGTTMSLFLGIVYASLNALQAEDKKDLPLYNTDQLKIRQVPLYCGYTGFIFQTAFETFGEQPIAGAEIRAKGNPETPVIGLLTFTYNKDTSKLGYSVF